MFKYKKTVLAFSLPCLNLMDLWLKTKSLLWSNQALQDLPAFLCVLISKNFPLISVPLPYTNFFSSSFFSLLFRLLLLPLLLFYAIFLLQAHYIIFLLLRSVDFPFSSSLPIFTSSPS